MAYSSKQKEEILLKIFNLISIDGLSLRNALKETPIPAITFYEWIEKDDTKAKQYARACEDRADLIFDEIITIADDQEGDVYNNDEGLEVTNHNVIQRSRLRVDARKWALSKMNPKKYGESSLLKLANNDGDELKVNAIFNTDLLHVPTDNSSS